MKAKSRKEALALGCNTYNTGKPCIKDHNADRLIRNGACSTCDRDKRVLSRHRNKTY